ncbi:type II toxin-antitoxin system RelE/ParE family toxin [Acidisoma silvae]|uniref:Type II toxin-antitoxin system RelE/ParE family toxin n=1 Tax=Acidisoma silvae TaxID=2802396 RepID=A0A963YUQ5_9PROT|nr:type II toxin-antitoxin system RelE/ParE family toxin [Acidisoma silvae]MCB8877226.1 type II toxin-antitoxin system RelE/ParE family toxin [Acidisoma silvae]
MATEVVFAPEALRDLIGLYDYVSDKAGAQIALNFADTIRRYCLTFGTFPQRGMRRDDLRPGLRVVGFRRRITIAFHVAPDRVVIDRILYAGRDTDRLAGL